MYCNSCGAKQPDDSRFCNACGAKMNAERVDPNKSTPPEANANNSSFQQNASVQSEQNTGREPVSNEIYEFHVDDGLFGFGVRGLSRTYHTTVEVTPTSVDILMSEGRYGSMRKAVKENHVVLLRDQITAINIQRHYHLGFILASLLFIFAAIVGTPYFLILLILSLPAAVKKAVVINTSDGQKTSFYCSRSDPHEKFINSIINK